MAQTITLHTYQSWDTPPKGAEPGGSESILPDSAIAAIKCASKVPITLTNLIFSPQTFSGLYTTYYINSGILSAIPAASISATAPKDQLALVRESFGFSITKISEIFGKSRPTIYQWMKDGIPDANIRRKLATLTHAGHYWKSMTKGSDQSWLLEEPSSQNDTLSINDLLKLPDPDLDEIKDLINMRLQDHRAATAQAHQILGNSGVSKTMLKPNSLTNEQQKRDQTWTRIRENLPSGDR
jgi:transcriptional regulator with XRE-family HTH domain